MKFKFLKNTVQPQRFNYNPMYYDERKERLQKKREMYERMDSLSPESDERRTMFRDNLRENWSRTEYRQSQVRGSNLRILLLIGLILALGYFVFNGLDDVDTVVKSLF